MLTPDSRSPTRKNNVALRVGCVSYLNAKPLIYRLDEDPKIDLKLAVPAMLLDGLLSGELDVALLPVIDYQRLEDGRIVPSGGIGCDGATLTVRIFSRGPIERINVLACDGESHTSVALARIVLAERFGVRPRFDGLSELRGQAEAVLLIGDKVVAREPKGMAHQLDLGAAWKELTGKPFVFAVWTTRSGIDLGDLPERLVRARELGLADLPAIVERHAAAHGWPAELAMKYLSEYLKFDIGDAQLDAIKLFHEFAVKHGIMDMSSPRPLLLY
jgi:chorismate dehydratase